MAPMHIIIRAEMTRNPVPDRAAASALGGALRGVGYSQAAVIDVLGDDAYSIDRDDAPAAERRLGRDALGSIIRVCFLQLPVLVRDAEGAVGRRGVEALETIGLATVHRRELVPRVRILPVGDLLVASDDYPGDEEPPDYVAAYTPTSQLCETLTPRPRVARALDVGTGSGVQALFAARHAQRVVATDVNERALAYTELNAALNDLANIECRLGSLFEPVVGERFDLITSNAPYVISPENRLVYRDAGFEGDELSQRIVRNAAEHLNDGGFATLFVSWLAEDEDAPDEHVLSWTDGLGCDSWILPVWGDDPIGHATTWNEGLESDHAAFVAAVDEWTSYLERLGARWITEGIVLLHRRPGGRYTARVDEVEEDDLDNAGDQIRRAFASRARLATLGGRDDLLDTRLSIASALRLEDELELKGDGPTIATAYIHLDEGTNSSVETDPRVLDVVAALDGEAPLGEVVQSIADELNLSDDEVPRLRLESLNVARELLELGALQFSA
jgi:methylase of polypeptide subunit release factors